MNNFKTFKVASIPSETHAERNKMNIFKVANMPSEKHAETNMVYVHNSDIHKVGPYVLINGFPFNTCIDTQVVPGNIAMNMIQRRCCSTV